MAITKLLLNGIEYDMGNIYEIKTEGPQLYMGRELSEYTWAQLQTKCKNNDFSGLRVGDYKTIQITDGETVKMQIAGIDTYYNTTDQAVPHHIDWISIDCLTNYIQWNAENKNNGTAAQPYPYLGSKVYNELNTTVYNKLPADVKAVIKNKRFLMEQRYSGSGLLNDSTGWGWVDLGNLWLPSEYEVFGSVVCGTKQLSAGQTVQYPLFANNYLHRIKGKGNGGGRCDWWLSSVYSGSSTSCCRVTGDGVAHDAAASATYIGVPVCFRIFS